MKIVAKYVLMQFYKINNNMDIYYFLNINRTVFQFGTRHAYYNFWQHDMNSNFVIGERQIENSS